MLSETDPPTELNLLRLDELARKAGISRQALREYEQLGIIDVEEAPGSKARYPQKAVLQARRIQSLLRQNYTLEQIRDEFDWTTTQTSKRKVPIMDLAQLAEATGVTVAVLRGYVKSRLLEPLPSASRYLVFSDQAVDQCRRVATLCSHGMAPREVGGMLALFRLPPRRDPISVKLIKERLQRVLIQKAMFEELEQQIQEWLQKAPV